MPLPVVGTRVFVAGGGRERTCCKPPEPPPASRCTFTAVGGTVARLVHVEHPTFSLCLTPSRRPAQPKQCVLRETYSSSTEHLRILLNLPSQPSGRMPTCIPTPTPANFAADLHCSSTSLSVDTTNHIHHANLIFNGSVACLMKMTDIQIKNCHIYVTKTRNMSSYERSRDFPLSPAGFCALPTRSTPPHSGLPAQAFLSVHLCNASTHIICIYKIRGL
jgi:hypothetical protein